MACPTYRISMPASWIHAEEIRQFTAPHDSLPSSSSPDPKPLQAILRMAEERLRLIDKKIGGYARRRQMRILSCFI
jgi:hypothetical protein